MYKVTVCMMLTIRFFLLNHDKCWNLQESNKRFNNLTTVSVLDNIILEVVVFISIKMIFRHSCC